MVFKDQENWRRARTLALSRDTTGAQTGVRCGEVETAYHDRNVSGLFRRDPVQKVTMHG